MKWVSDWKMSDQPQIKFLSNKNIDQKRWDQCILNANNKKIYSQSWYLDLVADNWCALVYGDYEYVMPLPEREKYRIKYIYQPTYCQQLGISPSPPFEIQKEFASVLQKKFRLVSYQINNENSIRAFKNYNSLEKVNLCLSLQFGYDQLYSEFTKHAQRNIKVAEKRNVRVIKGLLPHEYLMAKRNTMKSSDGEKYLAILKRIMANTVTSGKGVIYAAYSSVNNLCAAALILFDGGRAYYINAFSTDEGKQNRAMFAIVNEIIREFAGTNLILDFEGSNIDGIARFYKGFGATPENYFYIYSNRLPMVKYFMK